MSVDPSVWKSWGLKQKGTAVLAAGRVTVQAPGVAADSVVLLTPLAPGLNLGLQQVGNIVPGVSFDIISANILDGSSVQWAIL